MGPPLSARQLPWAFVVLGAPFLALGTLSVLGSEGTLSSEWAAPVLSQAILLGMGGLYVAIGIGLIGKHSRLTPGSAEYVRLHSQANWRPHVTEASIAYWVGVGVFLTGFALLGIAEAPAGACYRGAPNPCRFSLSPEAGLEFWGTVALLVALLWFVGYGGFKLIQWRRNRADDDPKVQKWLEGEGPIE